MWQDIANWLVAIITPLFGALLVGLLFRRQLVWAYHYLMVMLEYRDDPGNRRMLVLVALLACWTAPALIGILVAIAGAQMGHWSYWLMLPIFLIWFLGAILVPLIWRRLAPDTDRGKPPDRKAQLELQQAMFDAMRKRLGRPIKRGRTRVPPPR